MKLTINITGEILQLSAYASEDTFIALTDPKPLSVETLEKQGKVFAEFLYNYIPGCTFDAMMTRIAELKTR